MGATVFGLQLKEIGAQEMTLTGTDGADITMRFGEPHSFEGSANVN